MSMGHNLARRIARAQEGVAAIEFCLTLPILLMMTVGAYDISQMIATRMDYQQALTEVAGLAIAQPPQGESYGYLKNAAATAAKVDAEKITITSDYRCNNASVTGSTCPNATDERALYVSITVTGNYTPKWQHFGIDASVPMTITRTVRVQ